jgi:hypothetical protein
MMTAIKKQTKFNWAKAPIICTLNGYKWYLGPEAPEPMAWDGATEWCKSVGGELPPRDVLFLASLNQDADWFRGQPYWSSTKHGAANAWGQYFGNSSQYYDAKTTDYYVRAVRAIKLGESR